MNYVRHVKTTIKKGADVELGPRTVILGPNGSGKSTILQSIELATLGCVNDTEGRDEVKVQGALARLFNAKVDPEVIVEMSDGTTFTWSAIWRDGALKNIEHEAPKTVEWPLQDLQKLFAKEAVAIQAWLEARVTSGLSMDQLLRPFPFMVRETIQKLSKKHKKTDFVALAKEAKAESKAYKTAATKKDGTIGALTEGIAPALSEQDEAKLRKRLGELTIADRGFSQDEIDVVQTELDRLVELYQNTTLEFEALPVVDDLASKQIGSLKTLSGLLKTHLDAFGDGSCQVCGTDKVVLTKRFERISSALKVKQLEVDLEAKRDQLQQSLITLEGAIKVVALKLRAMSLEKGRAERDRILTTLAHNDAVKRTWENVTAEKREVLTMRAKADELATAAKALEEIGKEVLGRGKADFERRVSEHLPPGEVFEIDLDAARFGLRRGAHVHSALSGAEWNKVLLAISEAQRTESTESVVAPRDRAWSRDTLTETMRALANSSSQILLMSTVEPESVEGWTILRVG